MEMVNIFKWSVAHAVGQQKFVKKKVILHNKLVRQ